MPAFFCADTINTQMALPAFFLMGQKNIWPGQRGDFTQNLPIKAFFTQTDFPDFSIETP